MEACRALLLFLFCLREAEAMPSDEQFHLSLQHHEDQGTELELSFDHHNTDSELKKLTKQKDQLQTSLNQLQTSHNNLTTEKDQLQTRFNQLQSTCNNITDLKRTLCESYGMTFDGGVCYYISNETKTWDQARQDCIDRKSDLIIIKSQEKQTLLERVSDPARRVWIGLTDRATEGVWKWVDGTPLTTPTFWNAGEPNNGWNREDCAHLEDGTMRGAPVLSTGCVKELCRAWFLNSGPI